MSKKSRLMFLVCLFVCTGPRPGFTQVNDAVFVQVDQSGRINVDPYELSNHAFSKPGLVIWTDPNGRERYQVVAQGENLPQASGIGTALALDFHGSRADGAQAGNMAAYAGFTKQLDQLHGSAVFRDPEAHFLTPPRGGAILSRKPTIRRSTREKGEKFPAAVAILTLQSNQVIRIPFKKGQTHIAWNEIVGLPVSLSMGLPPGNHTLRMTGATGITSFRVEDSEIRDFVFAPINAFGKLVDRRSPLFMQFAVEHLLNKTDERPAYLADALEILDSVAVAKLPRHLQQQREQIRSWLEKPEQKRRDAVVIAAPGEPTKIAVIDEARQFIASAQWQKAEAALAKYASIADTSRARGLTYLYRAVVAAEAGLGKEEEARLLFRKALVELKGSDTDRIRVHNNFADFLQRQAQDRLYNHAFQMAAGVQRPFLTALRDWIDAHTQYESALQLAVKLGRDQDRRAIQVNLARLYALLADVIRTVDTTNRFATGQQTASKEAQAYAQQAAMDSKSEPLTQAVALEIQAHLAFRRGDQKGCQRLAERALHAFMEAGHLTGAENMHRVLGLIADSPRKALRHLRIAHQLSEALRERIPSDKTGVTRAGFFARKAYTAEKIVELLIEQGKAAEALHYVELIRARGLQDVLSLTKAEGVFGRPNIRAILQSWPKDTAALEYFLGTESGWVFLIDVTGTVTAYPLKDANGRVVPSRQLVARVSTFLRNVDNYPSDTAATFYDRGFSHSWQDTLHELYETLVPRDAIIPLRRAKNVVLVPHHILHYFPFAALVTEPDRRERGKFQLVQPKFFLDEPFDLVSSPGLAFWADLRTYPVGPLKAVNAVGIVNFVNAPALPGVAKEIEEVRKIFGKSVQSIVPGSKADESEIKRVLKRPGLLLIATHGWNNPDHPLNSYLMCQPGSNSDGRLTAREVYHSEVKADIVVLNACYSGLADRSPLPGDDLFGLQRALLSSGARTVVSGLWRVDDNTGSILMKDTFRRLGQGLPISTALAQSQRSFLKARRAATDPDPWIHPYYWAVYSLVGDGNVRFAGR